MEYYLLIDYKTHLLSVEEFDKDSFPFVDELKLPDYYNDDSLSEEDKDLMKMFEGYTDFDLELANFQAHNRQWRDYVKSVVDEKNPNNVPICCSFCPTSDVIEWDTLPLHFKIEYFADRLHLCYYAHPASLHRLKCVCKIFNVEIFDTENLYTTEIFENTLEGWKQLMYRAVEINNSFVEMLNDFDYEEYAPSYIIQHSWSAHWWGPGITIID